MQFEAHIFVPQIIRSGQELKDDHVLFFMYQILSGVQYIHSFDIVHRFAICNSPVPHPPSPVPTPPSPLPHCKLPGRGIRKSIWGIVSMRDGSAGTPHHSAWMV